MDERHYLKMRAKAEEEYRKNLEALDRVWHMSHPEKAPPVPKASSNGTSFQTVYAATASSKEALIDPQKAFVLSVAVSEAMSQIPNEADISQPIILRKILERYPEIKPNLQKLQIKAQIAGMLSRMEKKNELERIKESHGSEPAIFIRKFYAPLRLRSTS